MMILTANPNHPPEKRWTLTLDFSKNGFPREVTQYRHFEEALEYASSWMNRTISY